MSWTKIVVCTLIAIPFAALIIGSAAAQDEAASENVAGPTFNHYKFYDLGTFNGPQSYVYSYLDTNWYTNVLNNLGIVAGWADTSTTDSSPFCFNPDCFVSHGFQWQNGVMTDLGVLAPGWSSNATWINPNGLNTSVHPSYTAGIAENGLTDPSFPGGLFPQFRAVLWTNGVIRDLGTLTSTLGQGVQSAALAVNNFGQVVGVSTNCSTAPNCKAVRPPITADYWLGPANKPTRAFLWPNSDGTETMQDLGTLGGTDAAALFINDQGQVAGMSYINSAPSNYCANEAGASATTGVFLWQKHTGMQPLGSFGGTCTYPTGLNNKGQIVGLSTEKGDKVADAFYWDGSLHKLPAFGGNYARPDQVNDLGVTVGWATFPGTQFQAHAVLWASSTSPMTDLGTVGTDTCSFAFSVNLAGQVVGTSSCNPSGSLARAFLWQNGSIVDLNRLIPASATLYLFLPASINDLGEIAGYGLTVNGDLHAFLLTPCAAGDTACQNAPAGPAFNPPKTTIKIKGINRNH